MRPLPVLAGLSLVSILLGCDLILPALLKSVPSATPAGAKPANAPARPLPTLPVPSPTVQPTTGRVDVSPSRWALAVGDRQTLTAAVRLTDGQINGNVQWSSSDDTVATVNPATGDVTALRPGLVTIVAAYTVNPQWRGLAEISVVDDRSRLPVGTPGSAASGPISLVTMPAVAPSVVAGPGFWVPITPPMPLVDVAFPAPETVWGVGETTQVCRSTDAGRTWTTTAVARAPLATITAFDAQHAWVAGDEGTVFRTDDGGQTWLGLPTGGSGRIHDLVFTTNLEGFMVQSATAYATSDGGTTWQAIGDVSAYRSPRLAAWSSHQLVIRSREVRKIVGLYQDGQWQHGSLDGWGGIYSMDFVSATKLYANVDETLIVSANGGLLWQPVPTITVDGQPVSLVRVLGLLLGGSTEMMISAATQQGMRTYYSADDGLTWQAVPGPSFRNDGPGRVFDLDQAWTFSAGNGLLHLGP
jgi:hypothetical protein